MTGRSGFSHVALTVPFKSLPTMSKIGSIHIICASNSQTWKFHHRTNSPKRTVPKCIILSMTYQTEQKPSFSCTKTTTPRVRDLGVSRVKPQSRLMYHCLTPSDRLSDSVKPLHNKQVPSKPVSRSLYQSVSQIADTPMSLQIVTVPLRQLRSALKASLMVLSV